MVDDLVCMLKKAVRASARVRVRREENRERKKNFVNISVFWQWARTTLIKQDEKKSLQKWNQNIKRRKISIIHLYIFAFFSSSSWIGLPKTTTTMMINTKTIRWLTIQVRTNKTEHISFCFHYWSSRLDWTDDSTTNFTLVQSPISSHRLRFKDQLHDRSHSLPSSRQQSWLTSIPNENIDEEIKAQTRHRRQRRHASDSSTNHHTPTLLVTSFLQYLRHQLRTTTIERKNSHHRHTRQVKQSFSIT